ncbi:MAG: ATP-binding protein [Spirochaetia bacterium]
MALYLCHTYVGILEFYTHLCALFGLSSSCRRAVMFRDIQAHILSMNSSRHLHPVLLIDEAHLLSNEILAEIRLLTNFHIDSPNALTVMLCGAETLSLRFGLSMLEALPDTGPSRQPDRAARELLSLKLLPR